jgi:zinc protease
MRSRVQRAAALVLGISCSAFWAVAAENEPRLPKDIPAYGPLPPISAPAVTVEKLANGMTLWLVPRRGFPKVAFAFALRGGMAADPKQRPGFSELLADTLHQGTGTHNALQIVEALQAAGGDLSRHAEEDALILSTEVLAAKYDSALDVLADIFRNASFPDDEVALAKRNAADTLTANEADPRFLARRALAKAMFGDHPYSVVSPTQESIARSSSSELRREFARRARPDQTCLVAVGDFESAALKSAITGRFGSWNAPQERTRDAAADPATLPHENPHAVFLVNRPGSVQTTFELGGYGPRRGESDFAAAEVANAIYGGMFGSRLIKNIREDKGYTYSPAASLESLRQTGLLRTRADVRNEVTGPALNEINYELNRMATTSPRNDEIVHAQRYLLGIKAFTLQSDASVAQQLLELWVLGLAPDELSHELENLHKVTPSSITAAGKKYFSAAKQTVVAVGEEAVIRGEVDFLGVEVRKAPGGHR